MEPFPEAEMLVRTFEKLKVNAAIFGQDGKEWATSPDFKLSPEEVGAIVSIVRDKNTTSDLHIAGQKFNILNRDEVSFSGTGASESDKFAVRKTHIAVVVASWSDDGPTLARGAEKVDNAADFMMNENY